MSDGAAAKIKDVGAIFALPFRIWMEPATRALYQNGVSVLRTPLPRAALWGAIGYYGLEYVRPNLANIYVGDSPGTWKLAKWDDPDATYFPPWLIAGWMATVGALYI